MDMALLHGLALMSKLGDTNQIRRAPFGKLRKPDCQKKERLVECNH